MTLKKSSSDVERKSPAEGKREAILRYLEENPYAGPKAIVEALLLEGIHVSRGFVSSVKSAYRKKRDTPAARKRPVKPTQSEKIAMEDLLRAKQYVEEMGDLQHAEYVLSVYKKLLK